MNPKSWGTLDYVDNNGHGTHVAGIILKDVCDQVELISCKYWDDKKPKQTKTSSNECFRKALDIVPDYVNYSSGGKGYDEEEVDVLMQLGLKNVTVIVAAGNNGEDLSQPENEYYPAGLEIDNVIPVGSVNWRGDRSRTSNYGLPAMVWELGEYVHSTLPNGKFGYMSGTSQATARHTNRLIRQRCWNEKK